MHPSTVRVRLARLLRFSVFSSVFPRFPFGPAQPAKQTLFAVALPVDSFSATDRTEIFLNFISRPTIGFRSG
jgi:hypothetical protein